MSEDCILVYGENSSNLSAVLITLVPWPAQLEIGLILTVQGAKVCTTYTCCDRIKDLLKSLTKSLPWLACCDQTRIF